MDKEAKKRELYNQWVNGINDFVQQLNDRYNSSDDTEIKIKALDDIKWTERRLEESTYEKFCLQRHESDLYTQKYYDNLISEYQKILSELYFL